MTIASSGSFKASDLRNLLGKTGSFKASDLRELHGIDSSGSFKASDLRGKSVIAVSVGSDKTEYFTGQSGQRFTTSITASVTGGKSPYSYNWTKVSGSSLQSTFYI